MSRFQLAACLVLIAAVAACGDQRATDEADPAAAVSDTASDAGAKAARALAAADDLAEALSVTRGVVRSAGLTIQGEAPSAGPVSPVLVLEPELVQFAEEARRRETQAHLTLADLAHLLGDMRWPWRDDQPADEQLRQVVRAWVRDAQQNPDDPRNFTPLFLAGMARQQRPAVDIGSEDWSASSLRLSFLEAQMILGEFAGRYEPRAPGSASRRPTAGFARFASHTADAASPPTFAFAATAAAGVCDGAQEWFGQNVGTELLATGGQWGVSQGIERGVTSVLGETAGKVAGPVLDAVGQTLKILKMAQLYSAGQVGLTVESKTPVHRPKPGGDGRLVIIGRAGISEEDYRKYQEALQKSSLTTDVRNCLQTLGLPAWGEAGDIAADADKWLVRWDVTKGAPPHVEFMKNENDWEYFGQFAMRLKRVSPTTSEAKLTLRVAPEKADDHPGPLRRGTAVVKAAVDVSPPPGLSLLTDVAIGNVVGLVKALTELGVGWIAELMPLKEYVAVPIEYHEPGVEVYINDDIDSGDLQFMGFKGSLRTTERHYGTIYMGEDSVWRGDLYFSNVGEYRQPDRREIERRSGAHKGAESRSMRDGLAAVGELVSIWNDGPACDGTFLGTQTYVVEGWPDVDEEGVEWVQLTMTPREPPSYWETTPGCPWEMGELEDIKVVPNNFAEVRRGEVRIPKPVAGRRQVIRSGSFALGTRRATTITVGGDPD